MRTFGIWKSLAAAGLTALVVFTAPLSQAADDKKTEKPREHREAPARQAPAQTPRPAAPAAPSAAPAPTAAPRERGNTPAPWGSTPTQSAPRDRYIPRDPRNGTPASNTPTNSTPTNNTPTNSNPASTIDRRERQGNPNQPTNNQPTGDRQRQRGFNSNQPANNSPNNNGQPNNNSQPNTRRGLYDSNQPSNNQPTRQGGFNSNNREGGMNRATPAPGITRNAAGRPEVYRSRSGSEARFTPNGRVETVQARGMVITHSSSNSTRIIVQRTDRTILVTNRSGHGYVQRPYTYGGQEYAHRTYFIKGRVYTSYYRPYTYRGIMFNAYVPVRVYSPGFYGYVYRPWARPISYRWGWYGDPWYGYYGGYFTPSPYYASPSLWLVDYIVAQRLAEAYNDRANTNAQAAYSQSGQQALTPEIRQAIADEVQMQLQAEGTGQNMAQQDPSQGGLAQWFSDGRPHTFVVSYTLDVTDDRGQGCVVTRGDVLQLNQAPPQDADAAYVRVLSSKGGDCRAGTMVALPLQDLQDIQNQMRESVSAGLGELQQKAGQQGIPALPPDARQPPRTAAFAEAAPPPDQQVAAELSAQVREADLVEQEVLGEARQEDNTIGQSGTQEISLGQTIDQVVSMVGRPTRIANLGSKQVYIYQDMKVTFVNGKVTDVQ